MYTGYKGDHRGPFDGTFLGNAGAKINFDIALSGVSPVLAGRVAQVILDAWLWEAKKRAGAVAAQGKTLKDTAQVATVTIDANSRNVFFDLPPHQHVLGKDCRPYNINDAKLGDGILKGKVSVTPDIIDAAIQLVTADAKYADISNACAAKLEFVLNQYRAVQGRIVQEAVQRASRAA